MGRSKKASRGASSAKKRTSALQPHKALDKIEAIRRDNNSLWMNILYLALAHAPKETRAQMKKIASNDSAITDLMRGL